MNANWDFYAEGCCFVYTVNEDLVPTTVSRAFLWTLFGFKVYFREQYGLQILLKSNGIWEGDDCNNFKEAFYYENFIYWLRGLKLGGIVMASFWKSLVQEEEIMVYSTIDSTSARLQRVLSHSAPFTACISLAQPL